MATQETLQQLQYPKFVSDRQQQMLNTLFGTQAGGGLLGQQQKIPGQQVAGFTPTQTGAMNLASQGIGAYQPYLDAAQAAQTAALGTAGAGTQALSSMQFDPSQVQQYMNPYQQNVTQDALKEMDRQGAMAQNQLAGQAVGAGAFGGSRFGIQQGLNTGYQNQLNSMMEPYRRLSFGQQMLQGLAPMGGTTQQTVAPMPTTNPYVQAAGTMGTLYSGLGSLMGNK